MERFSTRMSGVGYLRTGIFDLWFKYTDVSDRTVHAKTIYFNDE